MRRDPRRGRGAASGASASKMNTATQMRTNQGLRRGRQPLDYLPEKRLSDPDIARRMYLVGCCLLPIIWLACVARYRKALWTPPSCVEEEELRTWVRRSAIGLACAAAVVVAWTVIFQTKYEAWNLGFLLVT